MAQPGEGARGLQPPLAKSFRRINLKIQAFKQVLDLNSSIRETERAWQCNSFNDFLILAIFCSYLYGFNNVQNAIKVALKSLLLLKITKIAPQLEALPPPSPFCNTYELHYSLFSTGSKLDNFFAKNFTFGSSSLPLSKTLVALLVAFAAADRFSSDCMGRIRIELRNAAGLISFFFQT